MSGPLIVELKHVGIRNKGASMMLQCAATFLKESFPDLAIALPTSGDFPFEARRRFQAYQKVGHQKFGVDWSIASELLPNIFRDKFGVVSHKHVRFVLDCSGFAYGSQWPSKILAHSARHARITARSGGKYILLPQAFGPFKTRQEIRLIRELVGHAALVFARDRASEQHLSEAVGSCEKIMLSPDFTATLVPDPVDLKSVSQSEKIFTVVPNYKMFEARPDINKERYMGILEKAVRWAWEQGYEIWLLNHEGRRDQLICEELAKRCGVPTILFGDSLNANEAKWLISRSSLLLSSRYHACVSALSQGIPAVGTSWSHKYQELYEDYGVKSLLYAFDGNIEAALNAASDNGSIRRNLLKSRDQQLLSISHMWQRVRASIESVCDVS